jgi:L-ribulose-5-phosphate 4-epimerase
VQILEIFARLDYRAMPGVLVACHGPFTWGRTVELAVYHSQMLEAVAEMNTLSLALAPRRRGIKRTLLEKHYQRKHGKNAYYGQKEGKE